MPLSPRRSYRPGRSVIARAIPAPRGRPRWLPPALLALAASALVDATMALDVNAGDVFAAAPVGVVREAAAPPPDGEFLTARLGIVREAPPEPPVSGLARSALLGIHMGPAIAGLDPVAVDIGVQDQLLRVSGRGLDVSTVRFAPPEGIDVRVESVSADLTALTLRLDIATDAAASLRRIELFDGEGRAIPPLRPEADQVLVRAAVPEIDSLTPPLVAAGERFELVIRGRDLRGLPDLDTRALEAVPEVIVSPPGGVAVGNRPTVNESGTALSVPVQVADAATPGPRLVRVRTESGESTSTPSPANVLEIAPGPLRALTGFASPPLGVTRATPPTERLTLNSLLLGVARGPAIQRIEPALASPGEQVTLRLSGAELADVVAVALIPGEGIVVDSGTLVAQNDRVEVGIAVDSEAAAIPRRVVATLVDGRELAAPQLFDVVQAAPVVAAISPGYLVRDGQSREFMVQGVNFQQVETARLLPSDGTVLQEFTPLNETVARLVVSAAADAPTGERVLQLFNATAASTSQPDPYNTLAIVDVVDVASPFAAPLLGVRRERPRDQQTSLIASAPLDLHKGPTAQLLAPDGVAAGQRVEIRVEGRELGGVDSVQIEPADSLVVEALQVAADGESLTFDLVAGADAATGARTVELGSVEGAVPFRPASASQLNVLDPNDVAPLAEPDSYELAANGALSVSAADGVLDNDSDPLERSLSAAVVALPASGSLQFSADGAFSYVPARDFAGVDSFRYVASNGEQASAAATVTLTVGEPLDAVDDAYSVADNAVLSVDSRNGLLANDVIEPTRSPVIVVEQQPQSGDLALESDGAFSYTPAGVGTDQFIYRLVDDESRSLPALVNLEVIDVNEPPVAENDLYAVDRDEVLEIDRAAGVLANDIDPDGDELTATVIAPPQAGSLALSTDGAFTYRPESGFVGEDGFTYEVIDPSGLAHQAAVTIIVNETLLALPDSYSLTEDEVFAVHSANGLLANDSVVAQGELEIVVEVGPSSGQVSVANDGSFVFEPTVPDNNGTDSFRYFLRDDANASPAATVTLYIEPVNDPPRAEDDAFLTDENVELEVAAPGVVENDQDPEKQPLTAEIVSEPQSGRLQLDGDGALSYVPEINFQGTVEFDYQIRDPEGAAATATVRIDVTQPPTATNDVYFVDQNEVLEISVPEAGIVDNDHDAPEDDELTILAGDPPLNGSLEVEPDGTFVYRPDAGFVGIDTFTYRVTDGRSESNTATVTFPVGVTSFPKAVDDSYVFEEDRTSVIEAADGVLVNDLDADTPRDQLSAFLVRGAVGADVELRRDGSFTVTPDPDFFGETFFVYEIFDGTDISNGAVVTMGFVPVNDGVDAIDDEFSVERNTALTRSVESNDEYDEDLEIRFEVVDPPQHGSINLDPATGDFRYTPKLDFAGQDDFVYRLFQPQTGIDDQAQVTLVINAPPIASADEYTVSEDDEALVASLLANDFDADGDALSIWRILDGRRPQGRYLKVAEIEVDDFEQPTETRLSTFNHFYGRTTVPYSVTDGKATTGGNALVEVTPVPDAPVAADDGFLVARDTPLIIDDPAAGVQGNDFDPDRQAGPGEPVWLAAQGLDLLEPSARIVSEPERGSLVFSPDGTFSYTPEPGFSGLISFTYELVDATDRVSNTARVEIVVNSPPFGANDAYVTSEDTALEVTADDGLLANDVDPENDELSTSLAPPAGACGPCNGAVRVRDDGSFIYSPDLDFYGQDAFRYRLDDGTNGPEFASVAVTVSPVNDAPKTEDDTYRVSEDEILVVPEPQGVLRNDREVDGDGLEDARLIEQAEAGSVTLQADGSFTYVPDPDFHGTDTFRYRVFDSTGLSSDEHVEVAVTSVNDAPSAVNDRYATEQGVALQVGRTDGVLANDADVDSERLVAALVDSTDGGRLTLEPDGAFEYVPNASFVGVDRFTYQVDDGLGALDAATVSITVDAGESTVEVDTRDDRYTFTGTELAVPAPGVLANDAASGGSTLRAAVVIEPERGTLELNPEGGFTYRAPAGFEGVDGFTYSAEAAGASALARVTLNVFAAKNNPPEAVGESYIVREDDILDSRAFAGLLSNDHDFEDDALRVVVTAWPAHGEIELSGDGHFIYRPDPDFAGEDVLSYRVADNAGESNEVEAVFSVIEVNDAPLAQDDLYRTSPGVPLDIGVEEGLLANDSDIEGDELFVEIVDQPDNGDLDAGIDGEFSYRPAAGFSGIDSFDYAVTDLDAASLAEVRITVEAVDANRPPQARGESYSVDEDHVLRSAEAGSLLNNDSDPDGDELLAVIVNEPLHGSLDHADGAFSYRPDPDFYGRDQFSYTISDGELVSPPVTATITIRPINDPPDTRIDEYSVAAGQAIVVPAASGVLANDSDVEGDPLAALLDRQPARGEVRLERDGGFRYDPDPAFAGRDEFRYLADDGLDRSAGRVVVDVLADGNRAPVAAGEQLRIAEDTVLDTRGLVGLLANDYDPDGNPMSIRIVEPPVFGSLEQLEDGHIVYRPQRDAVGTERIGYRVSDGVLESSRVRLQIEILPVADDPVARADLYALSGDSAGEVLEVPANQGVLANDYDPDGGALMADLVTAPAAGAVTLNLDGSFAYVLDRAGRSEDRWRYVVIDPSGREAEQTVTVLLGEAGDGDALFADGFERDSLR
jgi:hypothetical protein